MHKEWDLSLCKFIYPHFKAGPIIFWAVWQICQKYAKFTWSTFSLALEACCKHCKKCHSMFWHRHHGHCIEVVWLQLLTFGTKVCFYIMEYQSSGIIGVQPKKYMGMKMGVWASVYNFTTARSIEVVTACGFSVHHSHSVRTNIRHVIMLHL